MSLNGNPKLLLLQTTAQSLGTLLKSERDIMDE
jgi:hypothetical protein